MVGHFDALRVLSQLNLVRLDGKMRLTNEKGQHGEE